MNAVEASFFPASAWRGCDDRHRRHAGVVPVCFAIVGDADPLIVTCWTTTEIGAGRRAGASAPHPP